MRFKTTLLSVATAAVALGVAAGAAAPANAAIPSNPRSISFDVSASRSLNTTLCASGRVSMVSDTGFQAGQPVVLTITNTCADAAAGVKFYAAGHSVGWSLADTVTVMAGDTISLAAQGGDPTGYIYARAANFVVPTAGSQVIDFDFAATSSSAAIPTTASHVRLASDNMFQPGSTTTTTHTANDATHQVQVSGDGTTWGASSVSTTSIAGATPTLYETGVIGTQTWTGRVSGLSVPALPLPAAATPVVNAPVLGDAGTVTYSGTGTPGDTIIIRDASGTTIGTATVDSSGNWSDTLTNPPAGGGTVVQTGPGQVESADVAITIPLVVGTPIINPLIAGGAALALVAGLGTVVLVRRRKAAVQA